jgi:hypothetical protein
MKLCIAPLILGFLWAGELPAADFYVDNVNGRDLNDGRDRLSRGANSGPVQSLRRALQLVASGDTVVVANTGVPYYESLSLVGSRMSGVPAVPLTIEGNGATLSGLRELPPLGWHSEGGDLWRVSFNRKGFYRLFREGAPLPEHRVEGQSDPRASLPLGHWCAFRGSVYFRQDSLDEPATERFDYAADEMGITLYQVDFVRIVDLNVQHFRVDGIHAQNMCRGIVLENVVSRENGRAGIAVDGSSTVTLRGGKSEGNGRESALITGRGHLVAEDAHFDVQPTVR